jgi:Domain of unknown function (DUF4263)
MTLPPEASLEDVLLRIRETNTNPNIGKTTQVVLKQGPQAYKVATLFEILKSDSKALHHYSLRLEHFRRKKDGWHSDAGRIVSLEDTEPREVEKLYKMLAAAYGGELSGKTGDVHVVSSDAYANIEALLESLPNIGTAKKLSVLEHALRHLSEGETQIDDLVTVFQSSKAATLKHIAAASRMVEYTAAYEEMRRLIESPHTAEPELQRHLERNPWMFGSEYSELLPRKAWTRDDRLDYMLRRTIDGYLEIVEIKTAFPEALFLRDQSHDSYYLSSKLSPVIGQVIRYIEEVERNRDSILAKDRADTLKIRALAIVGRDGNVEHQAALRNFNAHVSRIEIITFDQLLRLAERVLSMFRADRDRGEQADEFEDDIPF